MTCRVALDVTPELVGATGVARYSRELGRALDQREDCQVIRFAIGRRTQPRPIGVRHLPVPLRAIHSVWRILPRPRVEDLTGSVDVVHSLDLVAPPTRRPLVVTVHDLAAVELPELHPPRTVRIQRQRLAELGRAAAIVADSRSTADALARHGVARDRLHVAPLGLTPLPSPRDPPVPAGPFVLAVGTLEPRKAHELLIRAFAAAAAAAAAVAETRLVLAGPTAGRSEELRDLSVRLGVGDRLTILGAVDDGVLSGLYHRASLLCLPSLSEGFGLPVLEAMSVGLPALASDIPVVREVAGDAAVRFPPGDVEGLSAALVRVLGDQGLQAELRRRGPIRAAAFTWEATAAATVRAYECALALSR